MNPSGREVADRLLDGLTEDQRRAVTANARVVRIIAGAGSGKTRVLTRRIAHQARGTTVDPHHALALTFTRKAAGELRHRLRGLGLRDSVAAGTFHAHAYAQLRARWADEGVRPPALLDRRGRIISRVVPAAIGRLERVGIAGEIDWATARRIPPEHYVDAADRAGRRPPVGATQVAAFYEAFVVEKRRRRMVDFDDLLELCIRDLADRDYARTRHWRYRHLFVDEFQDVNRLQFDLLCAWLGPDSTLCVVGDPNQAIYAWNGADARYLEEFEEFFPGTETIRLSDNFRSTPQILAAAAAISGGRGRLIPHRPDGPLPSVLRCEDERGESEAVARRLRDRHLPGTSWSHQAVLVRTNAQTAVIAEALARTGIPFRVRDGAGLLEDPVASRRLDEIERANRPLRVHLEDLRLDASLDDDGDESAHDVPPTGGASDTEGPDDARVRAVEALDALARLAEDQLILEPETTGAAFVAWVRATLGGDSAGSLRDGVDIVTFHAAKGLEWRVVHLAGLEDGLVPIGRATSPEAQAEERRLFYVALTRAHDELHCTWAATRKFGNRTMERRPSPLLGEMSSALADGSPPRPDQSNLERVRALRAGLGVQQVADAEAADSAAALRETLRAWRTTTARAAGVSAFVVCSDRTIDALVERRPADLAALAEVIGMGPVKIARHGDSLLALLHPS